MKKIILLFCILIISCASTKKDNYIVINKNEYVLWKARNVYSNTYNLPLPEGLSISAYCWQGLTEMMRKDIPTFNNSIEAIHTAETGIYAFNHRIKYDSLLVANKKNELLKMFGYIPKVRESKYSLPETVGIDGFSNIFIGWHLYFFMRCNKYIPNPKTILEIGSGMGELARIFKTMNPDVKYTLLDIPESLFFAYNFLGMNFSYKEFNGFEFIPIQGIESLFGRHFDLVINTGSLQEMTSGTIAYYMDFIQNKIDAGNFYSLNYTLSYQERYEVIKLDNKWSVLHREVNPPVVLGDTSPGCNWLDLFVRRIK